MTETETETDTRKIESSLAFAVLFEFVLALGLFGMAWLILNDPAQQLIARFPAAGAVGEGAGYIETIWNFSPVAAAIMAVVFLQSRASFESKGGVR
jgi:Trk-type K+ transport system membrane component